MQQRKGKSRLPVVSECASVVIYSFIQLCAKSRGFTDWMLQIAEARWRPTEEVLVEWLLCRVEVEEHRWGHPCTGTPRQPSLRVRVVCPAPHPLYALAGMPYPLPSSRSMRRGFCRGLFSIISMYITLKAKWACVQSHLLTSVLLVSNYRSTGEALNVLEEWNLDSFNSFDCHSISLKLHYSGVVNKVVNDLKCKRT